MNTDTSTQVAERKATTQQKTPERASAWQVFRMAMLAGVCVSIGGVVFLKVGGVVGAVLFSIALLSIVHFKLPLYTGTAGFVMNRRDLDNACTILLGNIVGCALMSLAMRYAQPDIAELAGAVALKRIALSPLQVVILAILCGFLMTVAVKFAREKSFLPLLFAIPVFILSGFIHSIADAFYLTAAPVEMFMENPSAMLINYVMAVIGNFIGCNLYRIFNWRMSY